MKKFISYCVITTLVLMLSCHTKKKLVEQHTLVDRSTVHQVDSSTSKTDEKAGKTDSTKTIRIDSAGTDKKETVDLVFHFKPNFKPAAKPDSSALEGLDYMNSLINQAIANSDSLGIHIERQQHERRHSSTVVQNAVKNTSVSHRETKQQDQKTEQKSIKKADAKKDIQTKPDYTWILWVTAIAVLAGLCLFIAHKINPMWL